MSIETTNLYKNIPPTAIDQARPPQENLPRPPKVRLPPLDVLVNGPAYLAERRGRKTLHQEYPKREIKEGDLLRGNPYWRAQMVRTLVDTGWKLLIYGGVGTTLFWGISRLITGY